MRFMSEQNWLLKMQKKKMYKIVCFVWRHIAKGINMSHESFYKIINSFDIYSQFYHRQNCQKCNYIGLYMCYMKPIFEIVYLKH